MSGSAPPPSFVEQAVAFARLLWRRFEDDRCFATAASLSYTSLLALVPLAAIGFAVLSAFPVFGQVEQELKQFFFANFLPSAVDDVEQYFDEFVEKARSLTAIGVVGLAVVSLLLFFTIETAMNVIFQVSPTRALVPRLLVFWAILTLGPLLIGASFSIATYAVTFTRGFSGDTLSMWLGVLAGLAPTLLAVAAFTLFYMTIPNRPVRFTHALIGSIVGGLLFSALRWGLTLYVTTFPTYRTLYGTLAVIPIFLLWMYLSWSVVLVGAVITAILPRWGQGLRRDGLPTEAELRLSLALEVLALLYRSQRRGRRTSRQDLLREVCSADTAVDAMLGSLRRADFAAPTDDGRWLPTRDPSTTTLYDVYVALRLDVRAEALADEPLDATWKSRLLSVLEAGADRQEAAMSVSLQSLLLVPPEPAETDTQGEAAPLALRRTP